MRKLNYILIIIFIVCLSSSAYSALLIDRIETTPDTLGIMNNGVDGRCQSIYLNSSNGYNTIVNLTLTLRSDLLNGANGNCWYEIRNATDRFTYGAVLFNSSIFPCVNLDQNDVYVNITFGSNNKITANKNYSLCINGSGSAGWVTVKMHYDSHDYLAGAVREHTGAQIAAAYDDTHLSFQIYGDNYSEVPPAPPIVPTLTFDRLSQSPSDITSTNLFTVSNVNITYNITSNNESVNTNSIRLYYKVNGTSDCWIITNGTCTNSGFIQKRYTSNVSSAYLFQLGSEIDIYPATYNYNVTQMNNLDKFSYPINNTNHYLSIELNNISNSKRYSFLELYYNKTGGSSVVGSSLYYCNTSYDFSSNPSTSAYCTLFTDVKYNEVYNHTHGDYSKHILKTIPIINNKVNNVIVTTKSYILINPTNNLNQWNLRYISNVTRSNLFQVSINNGNTWTSISGTPDLHIHQYDSNQYLVYYATANTTNFINYTNSSLSSDNIDLSLLGINPPMFTNPVENQSISGSINITWINATSVNTYNFTYNVSVYYGNFSFYKFVGNTTNLFIYYNTINISVANNYTFRIDVTDEYNQTNYIYSSYWHKYARLNITAKDYVGNSITNFSIYANSTLIGNTTSGIFLLDNLTYNSYELKIDGSGFEIKYHNITITQPYQNYEFTLYTTNSMNITFMFESNLSLFLNDVSIEFISSLITYNRTAYNGSLYIDLLMPTTYNIRYSADGYAQRSYYFTLVNRTYNELTLYLAPSNDTEISATIYDSLTVTTIKGAYVYLQKYDSFNNVYNTVAMYSSDAIGKVYFNVVDNEYYKFLVDYPLGTRRLETVPMYLKTTSYNLYIDLSEVVAESFYSDQSITATIYYDDSTNQFISTYTDTSLVATQFCLYIKKYGQYSNEIVNSSCSSSSAATLQLGGMNQNITYFATLMATIDGDQKTIETAWKEFISDKLDFGNNGLFFTVVLIIMFAFVTMLHSLMPIMASVGLALAKFIGLINIEWSNVIIIFISSIMLGVVIHNFKK